MSIRLPSKMHGLRHYKKNMASYWKRFENDEITVVAAAAGMARESWDLVKKSFFVRPTKGRKAGIHFVKRGVSAYNGKDYKTALNYFEKALSQDPDYARAHVYLGNTHYKMGNVGGAVASWNKAIKVEPGSEAAETAREKLERVQGDTTGMAATMHERMKSG